MTIRKLKYSACMLLLLCLCSASLFTVHLRCKAAAAALSHADGPGRGICSRISVSCLSCALAVAGNGDEWSYLGFLV